MLKPLNKLTHSFFSTLLESIKRDKDIIIIRETANESIITETEQIIKKSHQYKELR